MRPAHLNSCFRFFLICLLLAASAAVGSGEEAPDAELPTIRELYLGHLQQNGGIDNVQAVNTVRIGGRLVTDKAEREFTLYRKRPNLMRMRVDYERFVVDTRFDGKRLRSVAIARDGRREPIKVDPEEEAATRQDSLIEGPFFHLGQRSDWLTVLGEEEVRGEPSYKIAVAEAAESPLHLLWLSQSHFQIVKDALYRGDKLQTTYYSDFFENGSGLYIASTIERFVDDALSYRLEIDSVEVNAGIFDGFFQIDWIGAEK